jgi:phage repressor protein C with HTH and peptisase S24 domain
MDTIHTADKAPPKPASHDAEWIGGMDLWDGDTPLREDEVELPLFREVELAAGSGCTQVIENHGAKLRFARSTLSNAGVQASSAACVRVSGNSMEPVLPHGTTVGIDTGTTTVKDGKMYAIDHGGLLRVKLLYRLPGGGIKLRSYSRDEHPDEDLAGEGLEHFRIIGRVFWYSVLLQSCGL